MHWKCIVASPYTFPLKEDQLCKHGPIDHPSIQQATTYPPLLDNHSFVLGVGVKMLYRLWVSTLTMMHADWLIIFPASFFQDKQLLFLKRPLLDADAPTIRRSPLSFVHPLVKCKRSWWRSFHVPRQRQPTNRSTLPSKTSLWHVDRSRKCINCHGYRPLFSSISTNWQILPNFG